MVSYKNKTFTDYLKLMYYLIQEQDSNINPNLFPKHYIYNIRALLQEKFNKKYTLKEVKTILAEELALKNITIYHKKEL